MWEDRERRWQSSARADGTEGGRGCAQEVWSGLLGGEVLMLHAGLRSGLLRTKLASALVMF